MHSLERNVLVAYGVKTNDTFGGFLGSITKIEPGRTGWNRTNLRLGKKQGETGFLIWWLISGTDFVIILLVLGQCDVSKRNWISL